MVQTNLERWWATFFPPESLNYRFLFIIRCILYFWQALNYLKMDLGSAEEINLFVAFNFCGIRISLMHCGVSYITNVGRSGHFRQNGISLNCFFGLLKQNKTKTKITNSLRFAMQCKRKMKYWLTISWQVVGTSANRIMTLTVSWRANKPGWCLFFHLELFVLGCFDPLFYYHLVLAHSSSL